MNLSSILGSLTLHADPESPIYHAKSFAYDASKTALNAYTIHLAYELRDTKIKVNSAHPGWVKTDMGGERDHGIERRRQDKRGAGYAAGGWAERRVLPLGQSRCPGSPELVPHIGSETGEGAIAETGAINSNLNAKLNSSNAVGAVTNTAMNVGGGARGFFYIPLRSRHLCRTQELF